MNSTLPDNTGPLVSPSPSRARNTSGLTVNLPEAQESSFSNNEINEEPDITSPLVENLVRASYRGQTGLSTQEFHRFGELPIEIRLRIWRFAINVPRVVEIEKRTPDENFWHYRSRTVPEIFLVNYECTQEARKCYQAALSGVSPNGFFSSISSNESSEISASKPGPLFFRPTLDIAHFKDFDFSSSDTGLLIPPTPLNPLASVWTLALNRETLLASPHPAEFSLRIHFTGLKLLVLLIDDTSDIDQNPAWHSYAHYEGRDKYWSANGIGGEPVRKEFCEVSTGPFELQVKNTNYARYIEDDIGCALEVEQELYGNFDVPKVIVAGCGLPGDLDPAIAVALPGRKHPRDCWCLEDDPTEEPERDKFDEWSTDDEEPERDESDGWNADDEEPERDESDEWNTDDEEPERYESDGWNADDEEPERDESDEWNTDDDE